MQIPDWIHALERRLGGWSIPHLIRGLVLLNAATFLLDLSSPGFAGHLLLDREAVLQGEFWRLITFIFAKGASGGTLSLIFFFFWMCFIWMIGEALEQEWGSFAVTLYILLPVFFLCLAVMSGLAPGATSIYIYYSLFFAFSTLQPNYEIFLFPLPFPIKIKWIAWLGLAITLLALGLAPRGAAVLVASYSSYLFFFTSGWMEWFRLRRQARAHRARFRQDE